MANGYAGKILSVNLTTGEIKALQTADYLEWGGGHGLGTKVFWDLCEDVTVDAFDPKNVVTLMTSPSNGTQAMAAGGRTEVQGNSPIPWSQEEDRPRDWFIRSGFGGRFASELKRAGWDGIAVTGKASVPVWLNIQNDQVTIEDAEGVWGLDTWAAQQEIWRRVMGGLQRFGRRHKVGDGYTTENPAVVTCGPAGERLARVGSLIHDGGHGAGNAGYGGVFGSKNLKAISVWGSGVVEIADPKALADARMVYRRDHTYDLNDPTLSTRSARPDIGVTQWEHHRFAACQGCPRGCFGRTYSGWGYVDARCWESYWYSDATSKEEEAKATDLLNKMGINAGEPFHGKKTQRFLLQLYRRGILGNGPGYAINADPIPMDSYGKLEYAMAAVHALATRTGIGDDLAEGLARFSKKYGLQDLAFNQGLLTMPMWGSVQHWTLPEITWLYESLILDGRDCNEHPVGFSTTIPLDRSLELYTDHTWPWLGDPFLLDYSWGELGNGIYTEGTAKRSAWSRNYYIFWSRSFGLCCFHSFDASNTLAPDFEGYSPHLELAMWNAITGQNMTYEQSLEIGRKIVNLDRVIHVLQGRHRDIEKPAGYYFLNRGKRSGDEASGVQLPYYDYAAVEWKRKPMTDMYLNRDGFEIGKTHLYEVEGWDPTSGWPSRATLEGLGLGYAADRLQAAGKLGATGDATAIYPAV